MESTLRPLTLGEILDRTAAIYRKNFLLLAGISAVYAGSVTVLGLIQIAVRNAFHANQFTGKIIDLASGVIEFPIVIIMAGIAIAAINRAVAWIHLNQPATIRGAYASVRPRIGRYIWLMLLVGLRAYWPMLLLFIPIIAFFLIPGLRSGGIGDSSGMLLLTVILGIAAFFVGIGSLVYAVWQALRLALSVPSSVVEDLSAVAAMRRSIELTEGSRGRIFVLALLVAVIQIGLATIGSLPAIIFGLKYAMANHGQFSIGILALQQVVSFFVTTFVTPIYSTGFMLFYYDQRVRKEGFDIEWMMQAAGLHEPAESIPTASQQPADMRGVETHE